MKKIMLSLPQNICESIISSDKFVLFTRKHPNVEAPFSVLIYEQKSKSNTETYLYKNGIYLICDQMAIGECQCLDFKIFKKFQGNDSAKEELFNLFKETKISEKRQNEILDYDTVCVWTLSKATLYSKPKDISEFNLHRPPIFWQYIGE